MESSTKELAPDDSTIELAPIELDRDSDDDDDPAPIRRNFHRSSYSIMNMFQSTPPPPATDDKYNTHTRAVALHEGKDAIIVFVKNDEYKVK